MKAETTRSKKQETETTNSIACHNRFEVLPVEEEQDASLNDVVSSEGHEMERIEESDDLSKQINTYCKEQRAKFEKSKKTITKSSTSTKESSTTQKPTSSSPQEKTVLIIGDSMVKNMNEKKLGKAARKNTVCHSYSGAKVGQIRQKMQQYWSEDTQHEEIILHVGTNDLVREQPEKVAKELEELINLVKGKTRKIAISSVIKRYDNKVSATKISDFNHLVHELCIKHKITFIDNDCIEQPLLNKSNLHLNKNGDRALGSAFCAYLKQGRTNHQNNNVRNINKQVFQTSQRRDWTEYLKYIERVMNQ